MFIILKLNFRIKFALNKHSQIPVKYLVCVYTEDRKYKISRKDIENDESVMKHNPSPNLNNFCPKLQPIKIQKPTFYID